MRTILSLLFIGLTALVAPTGSESIEARPPGCYEDCWYRRGARHCRTTCYHRPRRPSRHCQWDGWARTWRCRPHNGCTWDAYARRWYCSSRPAPRPRPPRRGGVVFACAPEVVEGNLKAVDIVLAETVTLPTFESASKLQKEVAASASLDTEARMKRYFGYLGIDSTNKEEVIAFVGAREIEGRYLTALMQSLDLSYAQAEQLAREIQTALLGDLSR